MTTEEILAAARDYTERGWVVHPLSRPDDKSYSPGKRSLLTGWQTLEETPENIGADIKKGCNIGLVTGAASGVDGVDLDLDIFVDELVAECEIETLTSGHRAGRGHLLFQHEDDIFSEKHHFIGIEYFGNNEKGAGSNLVIPPSVHYTGEVYKWKNPDAPLMKMPDRMKQNMKALFKREDELHDFFKKGRHCFTKGSNKYDKTDPRSKGLWDRPDDIAVHGMDGRRAVLAIMGELKTHGCTDDLMHMACKRFFGKDYDFAKTEDALKHIDAIPPKCETLRQYLNVECDGCSWRPKEISRAPLGTGTGATCGDCQFKPHGPAGFCKHPEHRKGEKEQKYKQVNDSACPDFSEKTIAAKKEYVKAVKDIPVESIDPQTLTIQELIDEYKRDLYVEEDINISLPLAFAISNHSRCDPDALGIIGPSGSGKTEVVRSLGDTENQFIYPISSLTARTFVSGYKDAQDLAPQLQNRMITIKDFTSILSKNKDEVSGIFADIRDILDGYIQKVYGSEVGKKEFTNIHSSFLFACTNAIEKYYSVYSVLGQRLVFFRPLTTARLARLKAMSNAGKEKEIREKHHALTMRLINTTLTGNKDRIEKLTQSVPPEMQERIGKLCEFLAIARTHIDRDLKGDMASLPEPELPTRLTKTLCKIVDAHSILYNRLPTIEDEVTAVRLIHDNIPTERVKILKALCAFDTAQKTSQISIAANVPTAMCSRVLNDLAALGLVRRWDRASVQSNSDEWQIIECQNNDEQQFKTSFLLISNYNLWPLAYAKLKGVIRDSIYIEPIESQQTVKNIVNKEKNEHYIQLIYMYLTGSHPSTFQEAEPKELPQEVQPKVDGIYVSNKEEVPVVGSKQDLVIGATEKTITSWYDSPNQISKEGWQSILVEVMARHDMPMAQAVACVSQARHNLGW